MAVLHRFYCINVPDCGYLKSIKNGMVDIMDGTTFLKVATYSCYPGYDLKGPSSRVCWSMEKWSAREPRCVAKGNYLTFCILIDSSFWFDTIDLE